MSSKTDLNSDSGGAEAQFRNAFDRLKRNEPLVLECGVPVTQNNVAREAGKDPSALKKSRFPLLVRDIQNWCLSKAPATAKSQIEKTSEKKGRKRSEREMLQDLRVQRDTALSLLVQADRKILELSRELERVAALLPRTEVKSLFSER
jgi:hypothetical protein